MAAHGAADRGFVRRRQLRLPCGKDRRAVELGFGRSAACGDPVEVVGEDAQGRRETRVSTETLDMLHEVASHGRVNHKEYEYARGPITTNTVEGYFSIFKRGMKGIYQHCSEKHLHRYLSEFDFRYSNRIALGVDDAMRADKALQGITGKRLTYRQPH